MKYLLAIPALALIALAAQADARENRTLKCRTSVARADLGQSGPALVANVPRAMTPISLNAVQMTDKRLTRAMLVEGLFARRTETEALEVTARFVNCTAKPMAVQARSSFLDKSQFPTEATSAWRTVHLPAFATGTYQERSIATDKVEAYLIELRSAE